jgi:protein tyrosine phosphatase
MDATVKSPMPVPPKPFSQETLSLIQSEEKSLENFGKETQITLLFKKIFFASSFEFTKANGYVRVDKTPMDRYHDVLPWAHNQICPPQYPLYLNASPMHFAHCSYLSAQGPLESTVDDFIDFCALQKITQIVTLVLPVENARSKCADWWSPSRWCSPSGSPVLTPRLSSLKWFARHYDDEVKQEEQIVTRQFEIASRGAEPFTLTQYHYLSWPDRGAPNLDLFWKLLQKVSPSLTSPILVHCSAGIGRSGTFIAAHSLMCDILQAKKMGLKDCQIRVNLLERILEMRRFREGMIQSDEQLESVAAIIKRLGPELDHKAHKMEPPNLQDLGSQSQGSLEKTAAKPQEPASPPGQSDSPDTSNGNGQAKSSKQE